MESNIWKKVIHTRIGDIATYGVYKESEKTPVIFLHGVYFDHHLWDHIISDMDDRLLIAPDMPWHGASRKIGNQHWSLDDCADMLIEILDRLHIRRVIAVGHSWGSMSILRAAVRYPERFESLLLCNMPFKEASTKQKIMFRLQHSMLLFRDFYTRQAAKALFGKTSLKQHPEWIAELKRTMGILSNHEIRMIDRKVILDAGDSSAFIHQLSMKALALKGAEDYVPTPDGIDTILVEGGHISPLEAPNQLKDSLKKLLYEGLRNSRT